MAIVLLVRSFLYEKQLQYIYIIYLFRSNLEKFKAQLLTQHIESSHSNGKSPIKMTQDYS